MNLNAHTTNRPATAAVLPLRRGHARARRGSSLVYMAAVSTLMFGFAAFNFDLSRFRSAKGELQAIADAAALNAANGLSNSTYVAKAQAAAADNKVDFGTVAILASDVTPGTWTGTVFVANGTPRNAVRVVASRTKAKGTALDGTLSKGLGWLSPDVIASSTVALINQAPYEWAGINSVNLAASNSSFKVTGFNATNTSAAQTQTTVKSNGSVTITGAATVNADVRYGTTTSIAPSATITGTIAENSTAQVYPSGSTVANLTGVTPVYSTTTDLNVSSNMVLSGGVYVVKNCNVSNCNISFTGPTTIVVTGNFNFNNVGVGTYSNLPANLKIITTVPGTTMSITNPTLPMYADFYAPETAFTYSAASGYQGLRGRGVFKSMAASGAGASLWYDTSLTSSSLSKKAVVVE